MKKFKEMLAETVRGGGGNMPVDYQWVVTTVEEVE